MNEYIIALLKCKNIGPSKIVKYVIDCDFKLELIKNNLANILDENDLENFSFILMNAKEEIEINKKHDIDLLTILDKEFPAKLYNIKDPIVHLYYKGNILLLNQKSVAIVGSRKATKESFSDSYNAGEIFSSNQLVVVSGLALGIDTNAHKGALAKSGRTIAVLPSDLINIIPSSNKGLAKEIIEKNGLIVSEYPFGYQINKYCYVKRNRIQSALSDLVLVIEAKEKSGTMNTVIHATNQEKMVYQLITNSNTKIKQKLDIYNSQEVEKIIKTINNESNENMCKQISLF